MKNRQVSMYGVIMSAAVFFVLVLFSSGHAADVASKEWGVHAAARTCHIARTGYDGAIEDPFEKVLPHAKRETSDIEVPGSCAPVKNVFHGSQILSWLASHRNTIEDRLIKTREIYDLVSPLVNPKE